MMILAKPMSSPSRKEKFPPPLMRFLRINVGSRSRGRSRSSPMFIRKKNPSSAIETTQEPSSPKVTCIGQVRVRRPISAGRKRAPATNRHGPCWWVRNTLSCPHFAKLIKPRSCNCFRRKWVWFCGFGHCRKVETREDLSESEKGKNRANEIEDEDVEEEEEEDDDEGEDQVEVKSSDGFNSSSSPPPKNALLLTRCRSAPYRSSSLANRFWGSPKTEDNGDEEGEAERPEPNCKDSSLQGERKGNLGNFGEIEGSSINGESQGVISGEQVETGEGGGNARNLMLTRCKSAPARRGERLNPPDGRFWREKETEKLGFAEPRSRRIL